MRFGKYRTKLHIVSFTIYYHYLLKIVKLWFLIGVLISSSQKLIERIYRKVEGYCRPENTMNQFNMIKIYRIFAE